MGNTGAIGNGKKMVDWGARRERRSDWRNIAEALERRMLLADAGPFVKAFDISYNNNPGEGSAITVNVILWTSDRNFPETTISLGPSGIATNGQDYDDGNGHPITGEVVLPAWSGGGGNYCAFGSFPIRILPDNVVDPDETIILDMGWWRPGPGAPLLHCVQTITIADDPPVVSIEAIDTNATENAAGEAPDPAVFRVSRTGGDILEPLTVQLQSDRGTATPGRFSMPSSVTIPAGQASADVTMNVIDDTVAEGVETVTVDVLGPTGTYLLSAPEYTGTATAQAVIQDNVSVKSITVEVIPRPPSLPPAYPQSANTYYGFAFYVKTTIEGESLDKVAVTQLQKSSTSIWDVNGNPITGQAWDNYFTAAYGAGYKKDLLDSGGSYVTDDNWAWARLTPLIGTNNGKAEGTDAQSFGLSPLQTNYNLLASLSRQFVVKTKNDVTGAALRDQDWGYVWSNNVCAWRSTDVPPAPVPICAGSNQNGGKGRFSDIVTILGLGALN